MPNIWIIGYRGVAESRLKSKIDEIMQSLGLGKDAVTTALSVDVDSCDGNYTQMPYVRVTSTSKEEVDLIIRAFKEFNLKEDLEWDVIGGFIPSNKMVASSDKEKPECPVGNRGFLDEYDPDLVGKKVIVDNLNGSFTFDSEEAGWGERKKVGMIGVIQRSEYGSIVSVSFPGEKKLSLFHLFELREVREAPTRECPDCHSATHMISGVCPSCGNK